MLDASDPLNNLPWKPMFWKRNPLFTTYPLPLSYSPKAPDAPWTDERTIFIPVHTPADADRCKPFLPTDCCQTSLFRFSPWFEIANFDDRWVSIVFGPRVFRPERHLIKVMTSVLAPSYNGLPLLWKTTFFFKRSGRWSVVHPDDERLDPHKVLDALRAA